MSKNNNIDNLFRDSFQNWEEKPSGIWDNIQNGLDNPQKVDDLFKNNLDADVQPSKHNWSKIEKHLPLSLMMRRELSRLSIIAACLIAGMLITLYFQPEDKSGIIPVEPPVQEELNTQDVAVQVDELKEIISEQVEQEIAVDNSNKNMKSVKVNQDEEFLNIDEAKIRRILQPLEPLPMDSAMARINEEKDDNIKIEEKE